MHVTADLHARRIVHIQFTPAGLVLPQEADGHIYVSADLLTNLAIVVNSRQKKRSRSYSYEDALHLMMWLIDRENGYTLTEANIRERIALL